MIKAIANLLCAMFGHKTESKYIHFKGGHYTNHSACSCHKVKHTTKGKVLT